MDINGLVQIRRETIIKYRFHCKKKSFNQFSDSKSQNSLGQQTISRSWSCSLSRKTVTLLNMKVLRQMLAKRRKSMGNTKIIVKSSVRSQLWAIGSYSDPSLFSSFFQHCRPRHGHWPSSGSNGCLLAANHEWQVSKRTSICQLLVL